MQLQRYEDVRESTDLATFQQRLVGFAQDMDFSIVSAVLATPQRSPGRATRYATIGNIPEAFLAQARDPANARRDPVHNRLMHTTAPVIYDQALYADSKAGDLWEMQAPFGYKTGIAVSLYLPGSRRLLLGVDREAPLPKDASRLARLIADLQLLAIHAQDAAVRLMDPDRPSTLPRLSHTQLEVLRLTMENKSAWVAGQLLGISEDTVNYHLRQVFKKLEVSSKHQAVHRALDLGLL